MIVNIVVNFYLEKQQNSITRGHSLNSFASRNVNVWNSLPEIVMSADTTDTLKRRLDKCWQHQDILLYDYKVELTGVGNRSQINANDNCTSALLIFRLHKLGIEAHAYAHYTSLLCFCFDVSTYH